MRRYNNINGPYNANNNTKYGKNIKPTQVNDMKAVRNLFTSILPFTSMNRSNEENWLWASYNSCKLTIKKTSEAH